MPHGLGLHAELRLLRQTGLQPFQVLRMATLDAASAIGAENVLGSIKAGALADLILVQGDPLKAIEDAANVEMTMDNIRNWSPVLKEMEDQGDIRIVGGMYDISDGSVTFY